jgi:DNA-binding LacI/PurR family transcriptional regulator
MSVTGFDNVQLSEFCYPALTTVHIPRERIGQIVCDSLIPAPDQVSAVEHDIVIDPELVVRGSAGPAA